MSRFANIWIVLIFISGFAHSQTVFEPGDVAILGVNANNQAVCGGNNGEDISFICFEDLTTNTTLDFTDNGWQRVNANFWGTTEGTIRITRTGGTIPAGTVITIAVNNNSVTGLSPDNNWSSISLNGAFNNMNINTNGDQVFIMQGGSWSTGGTHFGTYDGTVLFGFSTTGGWATFTGSDLGTQASTIYPGMTCLNLAPTSATDYSKYTGPLTATTQRVWINRINDGANWTDYASCAIYNAAIPNYQTGLSLGILPGGFEEGYWLGITSNNWFDCENWENLRIPDADTDVLLRPLNTTTGPFVHPEIGSFFAECRSLDIQSGGQLTVLPLGELTVFEDIRNNGVLSSSGSVVLEGPVASLLWGASGISFRTLEINKSGGAGVQIDTTLTVTFNGDLFFTSGIVTPLSGDRVIFQTNAEANGASNASYVEGAVIKEGNEDFIFPVGDGFYQPIGIENIGTFNSEFEATFIDGNGPGVYNYSWVPSINNVATCSYWTLEKLVGTDAEVRLSWGNDSDCGITDPASLVVSRFDGVEWQNHGQQGFSGNSIAGSVLSLDVINNFSAFALASTTTLNPLPVEWLSFNVQLTTDENVGLQWETASETNNDFFAIEHANENGEFKEIGRVDGAGNSSVALDYNWTHYTPSDGSNYYRLRQTDFNGTTEYSSVQHILVDRKNEITVIDRGESTRILLHELATEVRIALFDASGKVLEQKQMGPGREFNLSFNHLAPGVYVLQIMADQEYLTTRILR